MLLFPLRERGNVLIVPTVGSAMSVREDRREQTVRTVDTGMTEKTGRTALIKQNTLIGQKKWTEKNAPSKMKTKK